MTEIDTFRLTVAGPMLKRGFWLYVWRVTTADDRCLLYVGRTGDNSSPNASPAYTRMGQHLGSLKNQNALRRHLVDKGIVPESCRAFDLVAHGPIYSEVTKPQDYDRTDKLARHKLMEAHIRFRDVVGAMEKRLAEELQSAGYNVLNTVNWRHAVTDEIWRPIRQAFAQDFPELRRVA